MDGRDWKEEESKETGDECRKKKKNDKNGKNGQEAFTDEERRVEMTVEG